MSEFKPGDWVNYRGKKALYCGDSDFYHEIYINKELVSVNRMADAISIWIEPKPLNEQIADELDTGSGWGDLANLFRKADIKEKRK